MKIALVSMMGNVGSTLNSQGGGYGLIVTKMIRDCGTGEHQVDVNPDPSTWNEYEALFVAEGVNFVPGSYNIPGGPQPLHIEKMKAIGTFKGAVRFINVPFDFEGFNKRLKLEGLQFPKAEVIDAFKTCNKKNRKLVIGDSHALSVWRPGWNLDFTAGRTLHGFLKRVTPEQLNEEYDETVTYFGNIDLRFHLARQQDSAVATVDLFNRYAEFSHKLKNNTVIGLLPVEHESRKLPGTGLYKGEKFFGTRSLRMEIRELAHQTLKKAGVKLLEWPQEWIDEDGTKMLDILEMKQSVHLKPKHYMYRSLFID
jgi:hypothetical protein